MSAHRSYLSSHLEVSASQALKEDIRNLEKAGCRISGRTRKKTVHYDGLVGFVVTNRGNLERETGFEPATACLEGRGSTTELLPHRGEILEGGGGWGQGRALVGWVSDTPGFYSVLLRRIFDCGVSVLVLSVGFWVGDGRGPFAL